MKVSGYPKPIERQRVSTCLKVFSEKTIVELEDYGKVKSVDMSGTVLFLTKAHRWWTIMIVISVYWKRQNTNIRYVYIKIEGSILICHAQSSFYVASAKHIKNIYYLQIITHI